MANEPLAQVLHYLRRRADMAGDNLSDGALLTRFVSEHDAAAFCELVRRHRHAVMGVCHRLLQHTQDAEDALQATYSIRTIVRVCAWLVGAQARTVANKQECWRTATLPA
jgi:hypothetical protein